MMRALLRLAADRTASAAAEMALVTPMLLGLVVCTFELGHYFLSEHVVQKAVRDAARYAGRLPISNYDCSTSTVDAGAETQIQRVARSGNPDDGSDSGRLQGWTADSMTSVTLTCITDTARPYVNKGIYEDFPDGTVPVVTVHAQVPYPTLFATLGIGIANANDCGTDQTNSWACLWLNARSESAVFGA